jgi:glycosyltransferase involved in cell wall biosynthesis
MAAACQLLGHVNDIAALHQAFDLFVQSSAYEGTPNAVLEAMALETPTVATEAGGTAEILRHEVDGLITPIGDVEALAAAIDRCLREPEAVARRVASARQRVETDLSFDTRTRTLERLYEELFDRRRRRAS